MSRFARPLPRVASTGLVRNGLGCLGILLALGLAACELADPPPSESDVALAVSDWSSGIVSAKAGTLTEIGSTSTWANQDGSAVYVQISHPGGSTEWTLTLKNFTATKNTVSGSLDCTITSGISTYQGSFSMTGGTVRSLLYQDVTSSSGTYTGFLLINDKYRYDADSFQRRY